MPERVFPKPYLEDQQGYPRALKGGGSAAASGDEADHAFRIQKRSRAWDALTREFQASWMESIAMVAGRSDLYWSQSQSRLRPEPGLPRQSTHRTAILLRLVEQLVSVFTREEPIPHATPTGTSYESFEKASNTELVLQHDDRVLGLADVFDEVFRGGFTTGLWWVRWGWDPFAGDRLRQQVMEVYEDGKGFLGRRPALVNGIPQTVDGWTGMPYARAISPLNIEFDLGALHLEERGVFKPRHVTEKSLYPVEAIEDAYPHVRGKITPDRTPETSPLRDLLFGGAGGTVGSDDAENLGLIFEEWTPWSALYGADRKKHPNGRVVRVCQGHVLEVFDNPHEGRIPFVPFGCYPVLGRAMPQGLVSHMIPAVKGYHRMAAREHDAIIYSVMKLVMPTTQKPAEGHMRTEQGELLPFDPREAQGAQPFYLLPPPDATTPYRAKQAAYINEIQDGAAVHEALQGAPVPGGRSGRQMFAAVQANLMSHGGLERRWKRRREEVYEGIAFCERKFGTTSRTFAITGSELSKSATFAPSESIEYADIQIQTMSALSVSEPAMQEYILGLWDRGVIIDDLGRPDVHELRRMLKVGTRSAVFEEECTVRRGAMEMIDEIIQGGQPQYGPDPNGQPMLLNPAWNMEVVHRVFKSFLNDPKWRSYPPQIQRAVLDRWDMTVTRLQGVAPGGTVSPSGAGVGQAGRPQPPNPAAGAGGGGRQESGLARALVNGGQGGPN